MSKDSLKNCLRRVKKTFAIMPYSDSLLVIYPLKCVLIEKWADQCEKGFCFLLFLSIPELAKLQV